MRSLSLLFLAACGASAVPPDLADLEGTAEDAYDQALLGDHDAVSQDAVTLDAGWQGFRAQAAADGAADTDLTAMDLAIQGLSNAAGEAGAISDLELARAANAVSAPMDELFALYDDPVPAAILALDYGGREVSIDAMEAAMGDALEDIGELDAVWAAVRSQVIDAGGEAEAADYESSLAAQRALAEQSDAEGLLAESNNGLELVDALEGVFAGHGG